MNCTERRTALRRILAGSACVYPASVFDPVSARIAEDLGYEAGMLAGSVASFTVLGAPDRVLLTLTELAQQARRICRSSQLPLIVDADHGYGNALNVRRTVEELEAAGVAGLTIEDTALPVAHGNPGKHLVSVREALDKMRAAVDARSDAALCVFGRTTAFGTVALDDALARVDAYARTGVDGLFLVGISDWTQLEAVRARTTLPLLLGGTGPQMKDRVRLAGLGVAIALQGHAPFRAAAQAVEDTLRRMRSEAGDEVPAPDGAVLLDRVLRRGRYDAWMRDYLGAS
ncbi:Oxaloacetate decarboxylase [Pigmentiphaga humi]|uniref:Oxaloacetate decarboxylase n=1 Tax=Pigmentiphaga humi TaxID=2478468 RepID=A0A3P4B6N6_9BURK|nr:isocitrate lyase/PEP mutase family protein [Pigmentiphaga humi]VCU71953.1 Oxaloacetate decarboxylase [Pigmentiphaga humi]